MARVALFLTAASMLLACSAADGPSSADRIVEAQACERACATYRWAPVFSGGALCGVLAECWCVPEDPEPADPCSSGVPMRCLEEQLGAASAPVPGSATSSACPGPLRYDGSSLYLRTNDGDVLLATRAALRLPFSTPGCYPTGTVFGSDAIVFSRASPAETCAAGELRVGTRGAVVEPAVTNAVASPIDLTGPGWTLDSGVTLTTGSDSCPSAEGAMSLVDASGFGETASASTAAALSGVGPFTVSALTAAPLGQPGPVSISGACGAGDVGHCFCSRSDGGPCDAVRSRALGSLARCTASMMATEEPVRLSATFTCPASSTVIWAEVSGGHPGYDTGPGCFAQVQAELQVAPTGFTSNTRAADRLQTVNRVGPGEARCFGGKYGRAYGAAWSYFTDTLAGLGDAGAANSAQLRWALDSLSLSVWDASGASRSTTATSVDLTSAPQHTIYGCLAPSGALALVVDGRRLAAPFVGTGTGVILSPPADISWGTRRDGTEVFTGFIREVSVRRHSYEANDPHSIAAVGSSTVAMMDGSAITALLGGAPWRYTDSGVGGDTAVQIRDRWRTSLRGAGYGWLVAQGGFNDLCGALATASDTWATMQTLLDEARASGEHVIVMTIQPASACSNPAQSEQDVLDYNALIRSYAAANGLGLVDVYALIDDGTGHIRPEYDRGDHVHMNAAGLSLVYDRIHAIIDAAAP